jgi:ribosomal protein L37E
MGRPRALDRMPCPRCGRDTAYAWRSHLDAHVGYLSVREFRDHNDPATNQPCPWWKGSKTAPAS